MELRMRSFMVDLFYLLTVDASLDQGHLSEHAEAHVQALVMSGTRT